MRKRIKSYHLLEEVAAGGHATVHRVWDSRTDRVLALKVLHPHLSKDPLYLARFEREANLASSLQHQNVVRIYEVGKEGESHFIAMEFLPLTLEHLLKGGRLTIPRAVDIARQVARGLEAASQREIVHRDIKPQNILLDAEGKAKITDFGIARTLDVSTMTRAGLVMGTPQYMAPEQAKGEAPDIRADIYSLGVLLYQMLAGRLPFKGETPWDMIRQHVEERPDRLTTLRPEVPAGVAAVVDRCLEKSPADRYQSPKEMADALGVAQAQLGRPAPDDITRALREVNTQQGAALGPATLPLPAFRKPGLMSGMRGRAIAFGLAAILTVGVAAPTLALMRLPFLPGASPLPTPEPPTAIPATPVPTLVPSPTPAPTAPPPTPAPTTPPPTPTAVPTVALPISEVTRPFPPIQQGQVGTVSLATDAAQQLGVSAVSISAAQEIPASAMGIVKLTSRPPTATFPPGRVYSYLEIALKDVPPSSISKAAIRFTVPNAWLSAQQPDATEVALYSYDGRWNRLPTMRVEAVQGGTLFEGTAAQLSYFAVVAVPPEPPEPPQPDLVVIQQTVTGPASSALFTVTSSPWKLQYRTTWSGPLTLEAKTAAGAAVTLAKQEVKAGTLYETYVYEASGNMSLSVSGGPADGAWTVWVTGNPTTPPALGPQGTILSYTGVARAHTPQFEVASSPWLLRYETTWTGPFTLSVVGPNGAVTVAEGEATAGASYETYVHGVRGKVYLSAKDAPSDGRWVVRVVDPKPLPPPSATSPLLTQSGTGRVNTLGFSAERSPFRLVYVATWSGTFTLIAQTDGGPKVLVDRQVQAGVIYEVYIPDVTGQMYLTVASAPPDRAWSLSVWRVASEGASEP